MTSLDQVIPSWPAIRSQKRVYTRMVAVLFHEGHVKIFYARRDHIGYAPHGVRRTG